MEQEPLITIRGFKIKSSNFIIHKFTMKQQYFEPNYNGYIWLNLEFNKFGSFRKSY